MQNIFMPLARIKINRKTVRWPIFYPLQRKYDLLSLIPANDKLVTYYDKRGFKGRSEIKNIIFNESDDIKEYLLEGYELTKPLLSIYKNGDLIMVYVFLADGFETIERLPLLIC